MGCNLVRGNDRQPVGCGQYLLQDRTELVMLLFKSVQPTLKPGDWST
jgi:hypothetical protein